MKGLLLIESPVFSHWNEPRPNLHTRFQVYKSLFMFEVKRSKERRRISKFMWIRRQTCNNNENGEKIKMALAYTRPLIILF